MAVVELPIVEAAPQDAHDETSSGAQQTVVEWRELSNIHQETVGLDIGVGVVDTTVDKSHPWYAGQVTGDPAGNVNGLLLNNYKAGHATFIAGLVLEQAPAANVIVKGALGATGSGTTTAVTEAILDLVQRRKTDGTHEIDILNLSLGCYGGDTERQEFHDLFAQVWNLNPDLVIVVAAGNQRAGESRPFYPAALADYPNNAKLVTVGAAADLAATAWADFSNQGPHVTFRVCGVNRVSTFLRWARAGKPDGRWARWGGTSFSTATVSGMIAARMVPQNGARRTGQQAIADLVGNAALPASLPIAAFPLVPGAAQSPPAGNGRLAGAAQPA